MGNEIPLIRISPIDLMNETDSINYPPWDNFDGEFDFAELHRVFEKVRDGILTPNTDEFSNIIDLELNQEQWSNEDHYRRISYLALCMATNENLGPISIDLEYGPHSHSKTIYMVDGFHRMYAAVMLRKHMVVAEILNGFKVRHEVLTGLIWEDVENESQYLHAV